MCSQQLMCPCRYNQGQDVVSYQNGNSGYTTTELLGDSTVAIGTTQDFSGASNTQLRWELNINVRPRKLCRIVHCTGTTFCWVILIRNQDRFIVSAANGYLFIGNVTQATFWAVCNGTALPIHQFC